MQEETVGAAPYPAERFAAEASDSNVSGVSWAAIFAGAAASAALSLILVILGVGFGLSAISPWAYAGASVLALGVSTVIWLTATQIIASGLGGYLAGRLRVKWTGIHTDEVYFRDTAHGLLSWAVATLVTAAFMGSALTAAVSGGAHLAGNAAGLMATVGETTAREHNGSESKNSNKGVLSYFVDDLFRTDQPATNTNFRPISGEVTTIFVTDLRAGALPDKDKTYLGKLVAERTGLSQPDAEKRVTDVYTQVDQALKKLETKAKAVADTARKAAAAASLWIFVALLCGAFFASLCAIYGGRRRDMTFVEAKTVR